MSDHSSRPSRALVHRGPDVPAVRAHAPFRVEKETGWSAVGEVLSLFRRRLWTILIITAVAVGVAGWLASKEVAVYQAHAVIRLVDRQPGVGAGTASEVPIGRVDPILSELVVLTGRTVMGQAVDREGLRLFSAATSTPAGFVEDVVVSLPPEESGIIRLDFGEEEVSYGPADDRRTARYGEPVLLNGATFVVPKRPAERDAILRVVPRDLAIDYIAGGITTVPNPSTGGVQVTYTSTDGRVGPRIVNAVVEEYQVVNADMARQNVRHRRAFLEEQLRTTDSLAMVAQTQLSNLRISTQSYSASGRFSAEQGNLMSVEIQQAQLQADLRMYESAFNRVMQERTAGQPLDLNAIMSVPGLAADPVVGQAYAQLSGFLTEREAMVTGQWARAPTHPDVQRLDILIATTEERFLAAVASRIRSLQSQIGALGSLRGRALAKMSELPRTEVQEVSLTQNLEALQIMGDQLRDQYQEVRLEEAGETGMVEVVQTATRSLPTGSKVWIKLLLGLVVGLMLGGGVAVAREMLDDSISSPQEIEDILMVPNLAVVPEVPSHLLESGHNGDGGPSAVDTHGTEAYRILRTNLLFSQSELKTLVVTSAAPGEGKTMTSVNLAIAYAKQGLRVLLMECDLRRPTLGRYFVNSNDTDLAGVLTEGEEWREAIQVTKIPGLHVIFAGRSFPRAGEFLSGQDMKRLLTEIEAEYDMVILDTSPLLVAADATILGALVDGVLLVVRATHTDRKAVEQAIHQLGLVGANVVGTVLNDPEGSASKYGHYYDYSTEYEVQ